MSTPNPQRALTANDKAEILTLIHSRHQGRDDPEEHELHSRDVTIWMNGDSALSEGLVAWWGAPAGQENPAPFWIRETICFERNTEGWRIVHEQTSAPFLMAGMSERAIAGSRLRVGWASGDAACQPC